MPTEAQIKRLPIKVPAFDSAEELIDAACEAVNTHKGFRRFDREQTGILSLRRIAVNHLRHLTAYQAMVDAAPAMRSVIRGVVLDAIALAYPWLASECRRQKAGVR